VFVVIEWEIDPLEQRALIDFPGDDRFALAAAFHNGFDRIEAQLSFLLLISVTTNAFGRKDRGNQLGKKLLVVMVRVGLRGNETEDGGEEGRDRKSHDNEICNQSEGSIRTGRSEIKRQWGR
jgi:hypothetical protein